MPRVSENKAKKSKSNVVGSSSPLSDQLTGPVLVDGDKYLSKEDLALYELAQYKVANARQGIRLKQLEAEEYQRKANLKLASMQSQVKQLQIHHDRTCEKFVELRDAISGKYGVDFSKASYDDETGRISLLPDDKDTQPES